MSNNLSKLLKSIPSIQIGSLLVIIGAIISDKIATEAKPVKDKTNTFSIRKSNRHIVYTTYENRNPEICLISYSINNKT